MNIKEKIKNNKTLIIVGITAIVITLIIVVMIVMRNRNSEEVANTNIEKEAKVNEVENIMLDEVINEVVNNEEINNIIETEVSNIENKEQQDLNEVNKNSNTTTKVPTNNTDKSTTSNNNGEQTTSNTSNVVETPTLTGTDTEKVLTNTQTKYGVKINTYTTTVYNVYSDGSKTVKNTSTSTEYDRSDYKATTSELLSEAKSARSNYSGMISQVAKNVNTYRQEANKENKDEVSDRENLVLDDNLCVAASVRAVEMAYSLKFSHTRPNGSSCFTVLEEIGISYTAVGENIALGQTSANSVSNSWKNSQGHYNNMISKSFSKIGVGVYKLDSSYYWVQLFSR